MRCFVGLGSNLGQKIQNLEAAAAAIHQVAKIRRASPVTCTPALVPPGAPADWRKPYLNAVVELDWDGTPRELLDFLKKTELELGRVSAPRWAPRIIDLDLLLFGNSLIAEEDFRVPHAGLASRAFVLDPLKHLAPTLEIPGGNRTVLALSREIPLRSPLWMGVLNLTPDSFSDGGKLTDLSCVKAKVEEWEAEGVHILDLGAESTRPGAETVSAQMEWERLEPALDFLRLRYEGKYFSPRVSVDTRNAQTARRALQCGARIVNDVSGLTDPDMAAVVAETGCEYVLMHSLRVPAGGAEFVEGEDVVRILKSWAAEKILTLQTAGVSPDKIIFDPGIGFGKRAAHSLEMVCRAKEFLALPVRVLFGHSRKSFLQHFGERPSAQRDPETLGLSLRLAEVGVEILRVHEPGNGLRTFNAYREVL